MAADVVVGVDIATASVRTSAVDSTGSVVATAEEALGHPRRAGPRSEQDPDYSERVFAALRRLSSQIRGRAVAGLCVTATSGTVVPCDAAGRPAGPAILYDDGRVPAEDPEAAALVESAVAERVRRNGRPELRTEALLRVGWLHRHAPAARYLHVSDVVLTALAGDLPPTDTSHALKTGADPVDGSWPDDVLEAAGVPVETLPSLALPGTVAATVSREAAAVTGIPAGTALVLGMTDGCCGQISAGAVRAGEAVTVLGTTLVFKVVSDRQPSTAGVYSHRAPDGVWWPGGASNVGAGVLRAEFGGRDLAELDRAAAASGPAGLVRYPLLREGERFPVWRPDARGWVEGAPADEVEAYRMALEGVAFTERLGLELLGVVGESGIRTVGGGSRSEIWRRIRATVLGRPLAVPATPESGFGAAVLAAAATIHSGLVEAVDSMVSLVEVTDPDPGERSALEASYQRFVTELRSRGWLA